MQSIVKEIESSLDPDIQEFEKLRIDNECLEMYRSASYKLYYRERKAKHRFEAVQADKKILDNLNRMADIWQSKRSLMLK